MLFVQVDFKEITLRDLPFLSLLSSFFQTQLTMLVFSKQLFPIQSPEVGKSMVLFKSFPNIKND